MHKTTNMPKRLPLVCNHEEQRKMWPGCWIPPNSPSADRGIRRCVLCSESATKRQRHEAWCCCYLCGIVKLHSASGPVFSDFHFWDAAYALNTRGLHDQAVSSSPTFGDWKPNKTILTVLSHPKPQTTRWGCVKLSTLHARTCTEASITKKNWLKGFILEISLLRIPNSPCPTEAYNKKNYWMHTRVR